jgi:hypothetical protein
MKNVTKEAAIQIIIMMNTLPPQIDHISHSDKVKMSMAEEFIQNLVESEKLEAEAKIEEAIASYYSTDENGVCPAVMDAMF